MNAMRMRAGAMALTLVAAAVTGCSTVPVTGRHSFNLVPDSQANALGAEAYTKVKAESKLITRGAQYDQVVRVGKRIAAVAEAPDFDWEFVLIDAPKTVNAFCLPGGKVAVYSGLLPVAADESGLAVVVAHEIAHAIARHGSERMTDDLALQIGGAGLQQLLQQKSPQTQQLVMTAFGVGATVGVVLPFSRSQESEADHIGLVLMAKAGYDPEAAPAFWRRMIASSQGGAPPAFLSDHPTDEQRVRDLTKWMPEAQVAYRQH
jgi:predicted Zn-dependent protease